MFGIADRLIVVAESPSVWLAQVVARALLETVISGGVQNDDLRNKKDEFCTPR